MFDLELFANVGNLLPDRQRSPPSGINEGKPGTADTPIQENQRLRSRLCPGHQETRPPWLKVASWDDSFVAAPTFDLPSCVTRSADISCWERRRCAAQLLTSLQFHRRTHVEQHASGSAGTLQLWADGDEEPFSTLWRAVASANPRHES